MHCLISDKSSILGNIRQLIVDSSTLKCVRFANKEEIMTWLALGILPVTETIWIAMLEISPGVLRRF